MNRRAQVILTALLVFAIGAALLSWSTVYGHLIDPITRVFWLLIRMLLIVDQEVYWILLIFAGFILAALMVPARREVYDRAYRKKSASAAGRIESWRTLLESAGDDNSSHLALQRRLEDLQATVYLLVDGDQPEGIHIETEKAAYRPGTMAYFIQNSFPRWLRWRNESNDPKLIASVDQTITSLETALEIRDDRPDETDNRN